MEGARAEVSWYNIPTEFHQHVKPVGQTISCYIKPTEFISCWCAKHLLMVLSDIWIIFGEIVPYTWYGRKLEDLAKVCWEIKFILEERLTGGILTRSLLVLRYLIVKRHIVSEWAVSHSQPPYLYEQCRRLAPYNRPVAHNQSHPFLPLSVSFGGFIL